jgi:hypothetical protein
MTVEGAALLNCTFKGIGSFGSKGTMLPNPNSSGLASAVVHTSNISTILIGSCIPRKEWALGEKDDLNAYPGMRPMIFLPVNWRGSRLPTVIRQSCWPPGAAT